MPKGKYATQLANQLHEQNVARRLLGLPVLQSKAYTCTLCNGRFEDVKKTLWCFECRRMARLRDATASSSLHSVFELPPEDSEI